MITTYKGPPHTHEFQLSAFDIKRLRDGEHTKQVVTSVTMGHSHELNIVFRNGRFQYRTCDGKRNCPDGHDRELIPDEEALAQVV
ncbi:hypothetical protein ElyMa_004246800 [Elysia marginata]|uniref:Uncharacterized protein n=1 Tax=Elysia marginata TaxID=1093978 RepID=A0AAV4GQV4_9GAST|nr:hypothetical protein ElyMa_004246800 [Elysia marginata]